MSKSGPAVTDGPDGLTRLTETEDKLNSLFHSVFTAPNGRAALDALKTITTNRVFAPGKVTPEALLQYEGARWLVSVIDSRTVLGEKLKTRPPTGE